MKAVKVEIITIGDEILIGQIVDTNSAWMGVELNKVGISVSSIVSISDQIEVIKSSLKSALERVDIVLITGGLGPTKDDVTKKSLAEFFNSKMILDQETLAHVKQIFDQLGRPLLDVNIKQAEVPEVCQVIKNDNGTAPCMWFEVDGKIVVSMPGVPFEMKALMSDKIIPRLLTHFKLPIIQHLNILTVGLGESFLAKQIEDLESSLPEYIKLAYLPKFGQVRLRLSGVANDLNNLLTEMQKWQKLIIERLGDYVVSNQDITLQQVVLNYLIENGFKLSTAESCTGGYIAHLITQITGSSSAYVGGGVVYTNELKKKVLGVREDTLIQFSAVSEETVIQMAEGANHNFGSDYAMAVSGYAEGGEGVVDEAVGLIWIAIAGPYGTTAKSFHFGKNRLQNIERATTAAFSFLLKQMKEDSKIS